MPKFSRPFVVCCSSPTPSSSWLRARIMEIFSAFLLASQIWRLWRTRSWILWGSVGQIAIILRTCALSKMGCMGRCQIDMIQLCAPRQNCNRLSRFAFKHWEIMFSLSDRNMTYVCPTASHLSNTGMCAGSGSRVMVAQWICCGPLGWGESKRWSEMVSC